MRNGFDHELSGDVKLSVRRCYSDDDPGGQTVELTIETFKSGWFMSSLCLSPDEALAIARDLFAEASVPLPAEAIRYA